jgi:hypothetical protein
MRACVAVLCLAALIHGKTLVHPAHKEASHHQPMNVLDVSSKYHVNAHVMDLTQHVLELPEQTMPVRHSTAIDLEEDEDEDPVRHVTELPEQTLDTPVHDDHPSHDLEEKSKSGRLRRKSIQGGAPSVQVAAGKHVHANVFDDATHRTTTTSSTTASTVTSAPPKTGEKITASSAWGTPHQFLGDHLPNGYRNPLQRVRNQLPTEVPRADRKVHYDSAQAPDEGIKLTSGNMQINIHQNQAKNFLDAQRVQVGTSLLGPRDGKLGGVARYRVKFLSPFQRRPIVLVTTVPEGAEHQNSIGPHPDVFAASVSEIRLDHFVINVVRVDSLGNNGWGQKLYLDWIAMEYNSEYPRATRTPGFLMTHPAHDDPDLERVDHHHATARPADGHKAALGAGVREEVSDWDN